MLVSVLAQNRHRKGHGLLDYSHPALDPLPRGISINPREKFSVSLTANQRRSSPQNRVSSSRNKLLRL